MASPRKWKCSQCDTIVTFDDLQNKKGGVVNKKVYCDTHFRGLVRAAMEKTQSEHGTANGKAKSLQFPPPEEVQAPVVSPPSEPTAPEPAQPPAVEKGPHKLELVDDEPKSPLSFERPESVPEGEEATKEPKDTALFRKQVVVIMLCAVIVCLLTIIALLFMEQKGILLFKDDDELARRKPSRTHIPENEDTDSSESGDEKDANHDTEQDTESSTDQTEHEDEKDDQPEKEPVDDTTDQPEKEPNEKKGLADAYSAALAEAGPMFDNTVEGFKKGNDFIDRTVISSDRFKDSEYIRKAREYLQEKEKILDGRIEKEFSAIAHEVTALLEKIEQKNALAKAGTFPRKYRTLEKWDKQYKGLVEQIQNGADSKLKTWIDYAQGEADKGNLDGAVSVLEEIRETAQGKVFRRIMQKLEQKIAELKKKQK